MPDSERDALRRAIEAHRQVVVRRPSPLDLIDEVEAAQGARQKGT